MDKMTLKELLERAQSLASSIYVSNDDPDEWYLLRLEAKRVRDLIHEFCTKEGMR